MKVKQDLGPGGVVELVRVVDVLALKKFGDNPSDVEVSVPTRDK